MDFAVKKPFYKKPIFIGCVFALFAIVVMALIYYFAVYKKKSAASSTAASSTGTSSGAGTSSSAGISSSTGVFATTPSGAPISSAINSGNAATTPVDNGITTTGMPIIATLQKADPVFAQKTMLAKLTNSKTAATNLLSKIQEIQYWTLLSPVAQRHQPGNSAHTVSFLAHAFPISTNVNTFDYNLTVLSQILAHVINHCNTAALGNPGVVGGSNCTGKGYSTKAAPAAYNIIGQINAEAINYASKYLGTPLVGNTLTTQSCAVGTTCGYIPDLNNLIKSGTLHPPNIWLVCSESKDVVSKITKLTSLLTSLITNTAWIKQLPYNGVGLITTVSGDIQTFDPYLPGGTSAGIPTWYAGFATFMTGYIKQLNALISDVKTTAHDLGVISGYYNQTT